ncbi:MAG: DUF6474 family protein [Corynebacterium sp.]|nr:DUF6474 family protein [Corynebacterium sp.]
MADNAKLIAKLYKKDYQRQARALKAERSMKKRMADREIKKIRLQRKQWARLFTALRFIVPLVLPVLYRLAVSLRSNNEQALSKRVDEVRSLIAASDLPAATVADLSSRLEAINEAARSAQFLSEDQRRRAHHTINNDLSAIAEELKKASNGS